MKIVAINCDRGSVFRNEALKDVVRHTSCRGDFDFKFINPPTRSDEDTCVRAWLQRLTARSDGIWRLLLIHWTAWTDLLTDEGNTTDIAFQSWDPSWWQHTGVVYYRGAEGWSQQLRDIPDTVPSNVKFSPRAFARGQTLEAFQRFCVSAIETFHAAVVAQQIGGWCTWFFKCPAFDPLPHYLSDFATAVEQAVGTYEVRGRQTDGMATDVVLEHLAPYVAPTSLSPPASTSSALGDWLPSLWWIWRWQRSPSAVVDTAPPNRPALAQIRQEIALLRAYPSFVQFEGARQVVSHDILRNQFMSPLSIYPGARPGEQGLDLLEYLQARWRMERDRSRDQMVELALNTFPEVLASIEDLLSPFELARRYNLILTTQGAARRAEALAACKPIQAALRNIRDRGSQLGQAARRTAVSVLAENACKLHSLIQSFSPTATAGSTPFTALLAPKERLVE